MKRFSVAVALLTTGILQGACGTPAPSVSLGGANGAGAKSAVGGTGGALSAGGASGSSAAIAGSSSSESTGSSGAAAAGSAGDAAGSAGTGIAGGSGATAGAAGAGAGGSSGSAGGMPGNSGGASCGGLTVPAAINSHLAIGVHDPSMIDAGGKYYLFNTGGLLNFRSSTNLTNWVNVGNVFSSMPSWITTELGSGVTGLWAPDISYFSGTYHVYYAGSTFGSNHSVIGLATNKTLDKSSADYKWVDEGLVVESNKQGGPADNWNAIDPNLAQDATGQPWLVFGSFWSGIKLRKVDAATGKLATDDTMLYALANNSSIEAPSIIYHNGYYYLFVSYGACCKGVNSTYSTVVGRASAITGPYTNRAGQSMAQGHAEVMLTTDGRYIGPGGGTAFQDCNLYYYTYHYYDGQANGASFLMLRPITWSADDWPVMGNPLWQ